MLCKTFEAASIAAEKIAILQDPPCIADKF